MATIIIIDDSAAVRTHLKQVLESARHNVIEAVNGTEGLEKILKSQTADLVITDYNMPGLDGIQMLTKVKTAIGKANFYIFMLTTETNSQLKAAGKEVGVTAWMTKPFAPVALLSTIEKLMARKGS